MENFKTKELSENALDHLKEIGYENEKPSRELSDTPYFICENNIIKESTSFKEYRGCNYKEKSHKNILKIPKSITAKEKKALTRLHKKTLELLKLLNKNSEILDYTVCFNYQESHLWKDTYNIFPITPTACGSISSEHALIALEFSKNNDIDISFSYTDWMGHKKRYGTSKPCIHIS